MDMTIGGRFLVRASSYLGYGLLTALTASFFISDITALRWLGVFFALFLIHEIYHRGDADRSLKNIKSEAEINVKNYLCPSAWSVIGYAFDRALLGGGDFYLLALRSLLSKSEIRSAFLKLEIKPDEVEQKLEDYIKESVKNTTSKAGIKKNAEELVLSAFRQAMSTDDRFVKPYHLVGAFSSAKNDYVSRLFGVFGIQPSDLKYAIIFSRFYSRFSLIRNLPRELGGFVHGPGKIRHRVMNRAWTARPTSTLDRYSVDFTDLARSEKVGFLIGHEKEFDRLVNVLSRLSKPNALLIGEPGSGNETIVSHLAYRITKDDVPPQLFDKRLVSLQIGSLVAGAKTGELQDRVRRIIDEILATGNIILHIPDIHNLVKTSSGGYISAADQFLEIINSDKFPVIGCTYPREFKQLVEPRSDFANAFEIIRVDEIGEEDAMRVISYDSILLERQYKIVITFGAVREAVKLAHKYFRDKLLPSSAEELLKEALSDVLGRHEKVLDAEAVMRVAEKRVNIPIRGATEKEAQKLLNLEQLIHERLIDQEEAVKAVSGALREYRSGLSRKGGPIASFLFVGPTGVGKTELSKILAQIQFGSEDAMVRFDMSEFQEKHSIARFIGSSDGVAGSLTDAIRQKPYGLILLDEFEKAHPDILNLFLQVFDDGRLTDNLGRTVDFQNTVIIATSNAHSAFIKEQIEAGEDIKSIAAELQKKLLDYFRPELLNRFSKIIVFKNLSHKDTEIIALLQLRALAASLREVHGIDAQFDEGAIKKIAELGFSPVFGARPLRGIISDKLKSALAEKLLRGEINKGAKLKIIWRDEKFYFEVL
ncbi:MAG: Endopeptidase Clp ATP-binding chain [Parcubacteria group bacterium GW2011_GWB1_45_9]|nr:MAG: Endopeptidase Clp ATP-binding chain [Parcubacteria group bacterium GW2011_GWB1_45_9]